MARKTTTKKPSHPNAPALKSQTDMVEDAQVVVEQSAPDAVVQDAVTQEDSPAVHETSDTRAAEGETEVAPVEDAMAETLDETIDEDLAPAPSPEADAPNDPQVVVKKAGAFPMILGGLVGGGVGFGAAWYMGQQEASGQAAALDALRTELATTKASVDAVTGQLDSLKAQITEGDAQLAQSVADLVIPSDPAAALADLEAQITKVSGQTQTALAANTELAARITDFEKRPLAENAAEAAVAAYNKELDDLRARLEAQTAELKGIATEAASSVQAIRDDAMAEIDATRQKAEDLAAQAVVDERKAAANAALGEIAAATQSGGPYAAALAALVEATGTAAPDALAASAKTGLATPQTLQAAYPPLARAALAASRTEQGSEGGIGNFLRAQLGVRSLTPQEGDSPNAVLSRVEAAVSSGDLDTALTEIEGLPIAAKDILAPWVAEVSTRNNALVEVETLKRSLAAE